MNVEIKDTSSNNLPDAFGVEREPLKHMQQEFMTMLSGGFPMPYAIQNILQGKSNEVCLIFLVQLGETIGASNAINSIIPMNRQVLPPNQNQQ